jgi:hypothetical protein
MPRQFDVPEHVIEKVLARQEPISAYSPYLSPIHEKHVIGVNAAFLLGKWVDVIFFGDGKFYFQHQKELGMHDRIKVSCNPNLHKRPNVKGVKYVPRDGTHPEGITTRLNAISWNRNSGGSAINLAYHLGARRIVLVGFDMKENGNNMHWHTQYVPPGKLGAPIHKRKLPFGRHIPSFPCIARDAARLKVEIINASPDSALDCFTKMTVKEALNL